MADKLQLNLDSREIVGKKVNRLRREGIIPATVYGKGIAPIAVQINLRTFNDLYRHSGRTKLVELAIPGQPTQSAFVHLIQRHPVSREIMHADFLVVDLRVEVTVAVPITVVGESPLVSLGDAVLNQVLNTVEVRALPAELPSHVEADVTALDSFEKTLSIADLTLPEGSKGEIVANSEEIVATLAPLVVEEEEVAAEEAAEETAAAAEAEDIASIEATEEE